MHPCQAAPVCSEQYAATGDISSELRESKQFGTFCPEVKSLHFFILNKWDNFIGDRVSVLISCDIIRSKVRKRLIAYIQMLFLCW